MSSLLSFLWWRHYAKSKRSLSLVHPPNLACLCTCSWHTWCPHSGNLWGEPGGGNPTGWWGSPGHARCQLPLIHLACSNSPTKTKTQRSQRIYSKQEQTWGLWPQCPVPGLGLLSREVVSHLAQALAKRSPRLRHAERFFLVQLGWWLITHHCNHLFLHHPISARTHASCTNPIGFSSLWVPTTLRCQNWVKESSEMNNKQHLIKPPGF